MKGRMCHKTWNFQVWRWMGLPSLTAPTSLDFLFPLQDTNSLCLRNFCSTPSCFACWFRWVCWSSGTSRGLQRKGDDEHKQHRLCFKSPHHVLRLLSIPSWHRAFITSRFFHNVWFKIVVLALSFCCRKSFWQRLAHRVREWKRVDFTSSEHNNPFALLSFFYSGASQAVLAYLRVKISLPLPSIYWGKCRVQSFEDMWPTWPCDLYSRTFSFLNDSRALNSECQIQCPHSHCQEAIAIIYFALWFDLMTLCTDII